MFESLRAFEQAAAADPTSPANYAGLADAYSLLESYGLMSRQEALPRARSAAERAITLDPKSSEAHTSLSFALWEEGHRPEALAAVEHAIRLDERYPTARHWYSLYLQDSGRWKEAVVQAQLAHELAPLSAIIGCDLAIVLRSAGRTEEAFQLLKRLEDAHPTFPHVHLGLAEFHRRRAEYDLALHHQELAVRHGDDPAAGPVAAGDTPWHRWRLRRGGRHRQARSQPGFRAGARGVGRGRSRTTGFR